MKYLVLAFIISISIHFLLFNNYKVEEIKPSNESKNINQSSINYVQLKKAEPKKTQNKKIDKPIKKEVKKQKKKETPKKVVKKEKPKKKETPKKTQNKPKEKKVAKKQELKKATEKIAKKAQKQVKEKSLQDILLKEQIVNSQNSIQQRTLEDFLASEEQTDPKILEEIERLYGKEFETFTRVQKAFIKNKLSHFQQITQKVLNRMGYPRLAARLRISGVNAVEFIFYPDGSIKDLKITNSSGYEIFDDYTLELIEIAYKDYPKPKTPTKLKFYVNYSLY